jgi:hypothetical protein
LHNQPAAANLDHGLGFHPLQELQTLFRLLGVVALVVAPDDLVGEVSTTTDFTVVEPTSSPTIRFLGLA